MRATSLQERPIDQVPMLFIFLSESIAARYQELTAVLQECLIKERETDIVSVPE